MGTMQHNVILRVTPNLADEQVLYGGKFFEDTWIFEYEFGWFYTAGQIEWLDLNIVDADVFLIFM